jgi:hypothetical protein
MSKSYHIPGAMKNNINIFKKDKTNNNTNNNTNTNTNTNTNNNFNLSNYDSNFPSLINNTFNTSLNSNNIKPNIQTKVDLRTNNWVKIVENNNTSKNNSNTIKQTNFSIENYKNYIKKDIIDVSDIDEEEDSCDDYYDDD